MRGVDAGPADALALALAPTFVNVVSASLAACPPVSDSYRDETHSATGGSALGNQNSASAGSERERERERGPDWRWLGEAH